MSTQNSERPSLQKLGLGIVLAVVMLASSFLVLVPTTPQQNVQASTNVGMIIPYYNGPNEYGGGCVMDPGWTTIEQKQQKYLHQVQIYFIANIASGPGGTTTDSCWYNQIQTMISNGVIVLGYVPTGCSTTHGCDDLGIIQSQIKQWHDQYKVNGIFLDEMWWNNPSLYGNATQYSHNLGLTPVVGNPGALPPDTSNDGKVDVINVYESYNTLDNNFINNYINTNPNLRTSPWSVLPYFQSNSSGMITQSYINNLRNKISYIYITDTNWFGLPSYFDNLLQLIANGNTQSPPATATLTITSAYTNGTSITGVNTNVTNSVTGAVIGQQTTPASYTLQTGQSYTIKVGNFGNLQFSQWNDGNTSPSRTISFTGAQAYTAQFTNTTPTSNPVLTVISKFVNGTQFYGMYTELRDGTTNAYISSGYTTAQYTLTPNKSYQIGAADWKKYIFDHWGNDTSTNRFHTFAISTNTLMTAYYRQPTNNLTVSSQLTDGTTVTGLYNVLYDGASNTQLASGFTPTIYTNLQSKSYTIQMQNYKQYQFDHWSDTGSTNPNRNINLASTTSLIAVYRTISPSTYSVHVDSQFVTGDALPGYFMQLTDANSNVLQTGYTPVTFSNLQSGTTYYIYANDFGNKYFDHWLDGTTTRGITVNFNGNTNITAVYRQSPSAIIVNSTDMYNNVITGLYMQVTDLNNNVLYSNWTPYTFTNIAYGSYYVYANDYCSTSNHKDYLFDHWLDGTTTRGHLLTLKSNTYLTAVYRVTGC